jgi:hypothetical protein
MQRRKGHCARAWTRAAASRRSRQQRTDGVEQRRQQLRLQPLPASRTARVAVVASRGLSCAYLGCGAGDNANGGAKVLSDAYRVVRLSCSIR